MSNKKSFEFRMSKKVAELTQVVHMLFTRNHEKEVELEALKDAYEYEIELILKDARSRLDKANDRIREIAHEKVSTGENVKAEVDKALVERDATWQAKVSALEFQLREEKKESQNSRDLLIKAQQDIERLRNSQNDDFTRISRDTADKAREIERLKSQVRNLEQTLNEKQQRLSALINLEKTVETIRKDLEYSKETLRNSERAKEQLTIKNKTLEGEVKQLKRDLQMRSNEKPPGTAQSLPSSGMMDYGDELERLRREIQRYRNELTNREINFNRMFAEKKPVKINGDRAKSKTSSPSLENGVVMRIARERTSLDSIMQRERTLASMDMVRERTFAGGSLTPNNYFVDGSHEEFGEPVRTNGVEPSGAPHNRLPSIPASSDPVARLQKLMKPKPLPKELLSAKH